MAKKHILSELSKADYVTCTSLILIVNAFWMAWNDRLYLAISLGFVSMFFDYLDGFMARRYGGSPYGKVLDSLYDILGWVLFPALMVNIYTGWQWWSLTMTTIYCVFSAIRLSRFTVAGFIEKDKRYYTGMPVSYSRFALLVVPLAGGLVSLAMLSIMIPLMVSSRLFRKSPPILMQINLVFAASYLWLYLT